MSESFICDRCDEEKDTDYLGKNGDALLCYECLDEMMREGAADAK